MKKTILKKFLICIMAVLCLPVFSSLASANKKIVGYYPEWGRYTRGYPVKDIRGDILTHLNYAFLRMNENGSFIVADPWAAFLKNNATWQSVDATNLSPESNFGQLYQLKQKNPNLKVLFSIGGWDDSNNQEKWFSEMSAAPEKRAAFISDCLAFAQKFGEICDGFDIDWEFVQEKDAENFIALLSEMKGAFSDNGLLLTIAAPSGLDHFNAVDFGKAAKFLDFINIMAYDYHGPWAGDTVTNHNAPLVSISKDSMNVTNAIDHYSNTVNIPKEKIILGLPFYGRGFANVSAESAKDALLKSYDGVPDGTWEPGVFSYFDLLKKLNEGNWNYYYDEIAEVPVLYNPVKKVFVSYDDTRSIGKKCDLLMDSGLGGAMIWELDDDYRTGVPNYEESKYYQYSLMNVVCKKVRGFNPTPDKGEVPLDPELITITRTSENEWGVSIDFVNDNTSPLNQFTFWSNCTNDITIKPWGGLVLKQIDFQTYTATYKNSEGVKAPFPANGANCGGAYFSGKNVKVAVNSCK